MIGSAIRFRKLHFHPRGQLDAENDEVFFNLVAITLTFYALAKSIDVSQKFHFNPEGKK